MKKYIIPKGFHISHLFPKFYRNRPLLNFDFMFSGNCMYNLSGNYNLDCNKLYGLSFGLIHNTTTFLGRLFKKRANSFRIGWNCEKQNGAIQLHAYYYNDGVRKIEYICDVNVFKKYNCYIYFDRLDNKICVDINSDEFNINKIYYFRFKECARYGTYLFPYFGGTQLAPQRMRFYINKLN